MTNPLKHAQQVGAFSEVYHVVRTAMVVMDAQTYRIEVFKGYATAAAAYTARYWVQRHVTLQPTTSAAPRKGTRTNEGVTIWVEYPFASPVEGNRPKMTLALALAVLAEQHSSVPA
jgi:hypothetical protein